MIVVTGATGNVGRALVAQLTEAGHAVRALTRRPDRAELPAGAEVVAADFATATGPAELTALCEGATTLFLHLGAIGGQAENLLAAASRAGVRRVVLLSSGAITGDEDRDRTHPIAAHHLTGERAVRASGMEWTFLRPNAFATNMLSYAPQISVGDSVRGPYADAAMAPIHEWDVAAVAAQALSQEGHHGHAYRLTGSDAVTTAEQIELIGEALDRDLRFVEIPEPVAEAELYAGMPREFRRAMLEAFAAAVDTAPEVTTTVHEITGAKARTFAQWARDHADDFRPDDSRP